MAVVFPLLWLDNKKSVSGALPLSAVALPIWNSVESLQETQTKLTSVLRLWEGVQGPGQAGAQGSPGQPSFLLLEVFSTPLAWALAGLQGWQLGPQAIAVHREPRVLHLLSACWATLSKSLSPSLFRADTVYSTG
jgi:hypothetical protein